MERAFCLTKHFFFSTCLILSSLSVSSPVFAQTDPLEVERTNCSKNSAYTWDASRNRCIQKAESQAARHEVENCAALTDTQARKDCHKRIAEQKTGLNSDINSLPQGTVGKSAVMNGIASVYAIIGLINSAGSNGKASSCVCKKIFAVTSIAGTLTDIWLKIKAKTAMNELKNKYQLGVKNNAYDNQSKAFEYLKEEQLTVKEIAGREKTRNMLLTAGYGAAALMAIYEMRGVSKNPDCYKRDEPIQEAKSAPGNETSTDSKLEGTNASNETPQMEAEPRPQPVTQPAPGPEPTPVNDPKPVVVEAKPAEPVYRFANPNDPSRFEPSIYQKANQQIIDSGYAPVQGLPKVPGK
jgi:hypothetical protein